MKKNYASAKSTLAQGAALFSSVLLAAFAGHGATTTIFWDPNGTTSVGGNAVWNNSTKEWSQVSTQVATSSLIAWSDTKNYIACFSAGPTNSDSQGSLTVTVNRTNICSGIDNGVDGPGSCFLTISGGATGQLSLSGTINTGGATAGSTTINIPIVGSNAVTFSGPWPCYLNSTNQYTGITTVNGTLVLGANASINNSPTLTVAGGATLDVSAIANFNLSAATTLKATGSGQPATLIGGTTINLGSQPILLTSDGVHPSLTVAQGILSLNGNPITINKAIPLAVGDHTIIQQTNGSIVSSGAFTVAGTGIPAGAATTLTVTGGSVILTITNVPTATTVTPVTNAVYGQPVTLAATVAGGPSVGTVQFYDNDVAIGAAITVTNGAASFVENGLAAGDHPITASYTGEGGYFSSSTTNTVDIIVALPANSTPVSITNVALLSNGNVQMNFAGVPGYTYIIQATSDLTPPIQWTNIGTNTADINGLFNFTDTTATNTGSRYYQTEVQQ